MLPQRVATAVIGVPAILAVIWAGGAWFSVVLGILLFIAALEFYAAVAPAPTNATFLENPLAAISPVPLPRLLNQRPLGLMGAAFTALLVAAAHHGGDWWAGALALAAVLPFLWLVLRGDRERALPDWLHSVGGVLYIGWLGSHLVFLRHLDNGQDWVYLAVFATFANDTSAYFVGGAIGRTKLVPRISPGKTVEGALGAILFGALGLVLLNYALGRPGARGRPARRPGGVAGQARRRRQGCGRVGARPRRRPRPPGQRAVCGAGGILLRLVCD